MAVKFNEQNIKLIKDSLNKVGIRNPYLQTAILATAGKETGLNPISEFSYRNTSNDRIREVFGSDVSNLTDAELTALKKNNIAFYDQVYGGEGGNVNPGDGYKYRGRGFNQITFRDTYKKYSQLLGKDLINNPDLLNDPVIASDALAMFFANSLKTGIKAGIFQKKYGVMDPEKISDFETATKVAIQINAGLNKQWNKTTNEGYKKALYYIDSLKDLVTASVSPVNIIPIVLKKKRSGKGS